MCDTINPICSLPTPTSDSSKENPKLHELHVSFAIETLRIVNEAIDELNLLSKVDAALAAGVLCDWRREIIAGDAAYREAQLILSCGFAYMEPERYPKDDA